MSTFDDVVRFMFRHFLSLGFVFQPIDSKRKQVTGPPVGFCTSGSLFAYRNCFYLLTAGHVLRDIDAMATGGEFGLHSCHLLDSLGLESIDHTPIPFDYSGAVKLPLCAEEDGLDFGLIPLDDYYLRLLAANNLKAITEENWRLQDDGDYDSYWLLGIPNCWTQVVTTPTASGQSRTIYNMSRGAIPIKRLDGPPKNSRPTTFQRFVGHIDERVQITDIRGMSGGPILGFRKTGDSTAYWVVAIQSSWLPEQRVIFGCPVATIGQLLDEACEGASNVRGRK